MSCNNEAIPSAATHEETFFVVHADTTVTVLEKVVAKIDQHYISNDGFLL